MNDRPSPSASARFSDWFALGSLVAAAVAVVTMGVVWFVSGTSPSPSDDSAAGGPSGVVTSGGIDLSSLPAADPDVDVATLIDQAADAMGGVSSVAFDVERSGAPVFIDQFQAIQVDALLGQFVVPGQAQATIDVTVDGSLKTRIGAVALDDEVWISNPVTGRFETLPAGYDIDPSRFFDPQDGWKPLIENLDEAVVVGIEDRDGERYHLTGVARAADVENITAGLIRGQSVPVDIWLTPGTPYLTHAEFTTETSDGDTRWSLQLERYDANFTIEPPADIVDAAVPDASAPTDTSAP